MTQTISAFQQSLLTHLEFSNFVLMRNLEGITNEESLEQPVPGGNCLNWIVGHLLFSRHELLEVLGAVSAAEKQHYDRYRRGSSAMTDAAEAHPLDSMIARFEETQTLYRHAVENVSEERLAEKAPLSPANDPEETIESLLTKFAFHENYHVGQTGILRRFIGKEGMLK